LQVSLSQVSPSQVSPSQVSPSQVSLFAAILTIKPFQMLV
jgi:hypothetical protein